MHALWTHLHPDTSKPNIAGLFSSIVLLSATSNRCNPCTPVLLALGMAQGFWLSDGIGVTLINLTWSDKISFQFQLQSQWETSTSVLCLTSYVQTKTDLKCHIKYHGIYLTYQMAICLTKMPLLPLRYLSYKCWFSLIKIPDCRPSVNQISSDLLADIWIMKLCQQSHLSNYLFKTAYPVSSVQKECALCYTGHSQSFTLINAQAL